MPLSDTRDIIDSGVTTVREEGQIQQRLESRELTLRNSRSGMTSVVNVNLPSEKLLTSVGGAASVLQQGGWGKQ